MVGIGEDEVVAGKTTCVKTKVEVGNIVEEIGEGLEQLGGVIGLQDQLLGVKEEARFKEDKCIKVEAAKGRDMASTPL